VSDFKSDPSLEQPHVSFADNSDPHSIVRPPRDEAAGAIHHVIPCGNGDRRIVRDDRDRFAYVTRFAAVSRDLGWLAYATCLLDTHHHAVVETPEPNLGPGLRRLVGGHSRWVNVRYGRTGSVFMPHCWSRRIQDNAWLFRACLYVVLNPVAAGVCDHPAEWPWCSYRTTAEGDPERYAPGEERLLSMFGSTPGEARQCYAQVVQAAADGIRAERRHAAPDLWAELRQLESPVAPKVSD
jgi:REP element-mobilizing transposase RayT